MNNVKHFYSKNIYNNVKHLAEGIIGGWHVHGKGSVSNEGTPQWVANLIDSTLSLPRPCRCCEVPHVSISSLNIFLFRGFLNLGTCMRLLTKLDHTSTIAGKLGLGGIMSFNSLLSIFHFDKVFVSSWIAWEAYIEKTKWEWCE